MAKSKALDAVSRLVEVLEPMESAERGRVMRAALTLLGEETDPNIFTPQKPLDQGNQSLRRLAQAGEKAYFDQKQPSTKIEELAVAARFREEQTGATQHTQDDLKAVVGGARRNFDANNFRRDLENARSKGFFTRGTGKDVIILSHYGQGYVDHLPDRTAARALKKPKGKRRHAAAKRPKK